MSLREQKKQETENRIFEISVRLFKEKGFENTTIDEITKEAGIAKGTFFNYFPTKESLLFYFKEQKEEFVLNLMKEQISLDAPVKEKLVNFLILVAEYYEKDRELTRLLFFEHRRLIMASDARLKGMGKKHGPKYFVTMVCDLLQDGILKGEIKQNIDPKIAAKTLHAIYFHSLMAWLHSDRDDYSFSRDLSAKVDLLFNGIGE